MTPIFVIVLCLLFVQVACATLVADPSPQVYRPGLVTWTLRTQQFSAADDGGALGDKAYVAQMMAGTLPDDLPDDLPDNLPDDRSTDQPGSNLQTSVQTWNHISMALLPERLNIAVIAGRHSGHTRMPV